MSTNYTHISKNCTFCGLQLKPDTIHNLLGYCGKDCFFDMVKEYELGQKYDSAYIKICIACGNFYYGDIQVGGYFCSVPCAKKYKDYDPTVSAPIVDAIKKARLKTITRLLEKLQAEADAQLRAQKKLQRQLEIAKEARSARLFGVKDSVKLIEKARDTRLNGYLLKNARDRFYVLERDNFKCAYCGISPALDPDVVLQVDHVEPKSKGGLDIAANLITSCQPCNASKQAMIMSDDNLDFILGVIADRNEKAGIDPNLFIKL